MKVNSRKLVEGLTVSWAPRWTVQGSKRATTHAASCALFLGIGLVNVPLANANYREKAIAATDYIQRSMYDPQAGLYHPALPRDPKALPYEFMWGNGVQLSVLAAAATYEPKRYKSTLYAFTKGMERHWDKDASVPGYDAYFSSKDGDDKYYDDNAWMVLGYAEAYRGTKDKLFLDWAKKSFKFVLSGYDQKLGGGIYWYQKTRDSKNTCINAPGAVGALALYNITKDPDDLEWAKKLYSWTKTHLQDTDGLYFDNVHLTGKVEKTKWTYNTALMIEAAVGLWRVTKDPKYLSEAIRVSDAAIARFITPETGAMADSARFNNWLCEALVTTYEASKEIRFLNAVRRHADFGYRYVRDVTDGGYWNKWNAAPRAPGSEKTLIENASAARIFWLLAPYDDVTELRAKGIRAFRAGNNAAANGYFQQAFNSTAGTEPTVIVKPEIKAPVGFGVAN